MQPRGPIGRKRSSAERSPISSAFQKLHIEYWPIERLKPYERNPRMNDKAVDRIRASIREFGFAVPILAKSDGEVIDGHLRLKGAIAEKMREVPVSRGLCASGSRRELGGRSVLRWSRAERTAIHSRSR